MIGSQAFGLTGIRGYFNCRVIYVPMEISSRRNSGFVNGLTRIRQAGNSIQRQCILIPPSTRQRRRS